MTILTPWAEIKINDSIQRLTKETKSDCTGGHTLMQYYNVSQKDGTTILFE